jgi:hypothetical protein
MATAYLTQKDADDYGYDVLDLAQRAALHAVSPDLARLEHNNAALREQLASTSQHLLEQAVAREVPNWKEINVDPVWLQWLAGRDPYSGWTRQQLLDDAVRSGNSYRVVSLFRGFLQAGAAGRASAPAASVPTGKRSYTRADIVKYSDAYRRGQISEADYQRLQADIHAAVGENRILDPPMRGVGKAPYG